ncbi:hypothetical protein GGI15_002071 [Coemansia interrupta]|uniref:Uncharacterized protein n=1 Tax=Coemansia interrupta TaxID=1126814 RepID=A0A9W8HK40_9FUNG|nr:hypothetical protein GGI15_002071 [Coemansia interrupta]
MLRGCILFFVGLILFLQALASIVETGIYIGEKVVLDHNHLAYSKGWLYYFKWVVKPLSASVAVSLFFSALCSCCCGGPDRVTGRGGRTFPMVMAFFSFVLTVLWAIIVGFMVHYSDETTGTAIVNNTIANQAFVYPLGKGFSLKNDCEAIPFTAMDHGTTACRLLLVESGISIVCLGLWAILFIFSFFLLCAVRRIQNKHVSPTVEAFSPSAHHFKN